MNAKLAKKLRADALRLCIEHGIPLNTGYNNRVIGQRHYRVRQTDAETGEDVYKMVTLDVIDTTMTPCLRKVIKDAKKRLLTN